MQAFGMDSPVNMAPSSSSPYAIGNAAIGASVLLHYDFDMKSPPWHVKQVEPDVSKLKEEFAEILLRRPHEPFEAAKTVTGDDEKLFGLVYSRSKSWPTDSYVKEHQKKLIEEFGARYFMPTREEMAHEFWYRIRERRIDGGRMMDDRDAIAAATFVGNIAGYLTKSPANEIESQTNIQQNITLNFVSPETQPKIADIKTIDNEPSSKNDAVYLVPITFKDDE